MFLVEFKQLHRYFLFSAHMPNKPTKFPKHRLIILRHMLRRLNSPTAGNPAESAAHITDNNLNKRKLTTYCSNA